MAIGSTNPTNNLTKIKGVDVSVGAGNTDPGTQRVTISTNQTVIPVSDNGGSLTVDGTVSVTGVSTETTLSALNTKIPSNLTTKAASTATTGTDPSLVVALSPNSPLPSGTNTLGTVELGAASLAALENISVTIPGTVDLGTVSLSALETITVNDGSGSLTVDAPVTTPVFVRLSSGTAAVDTIPVTGTFWPATQPVSIASLPTLAAGTNTIGNIGTVSTVTNLSQLGGNAIAMGTGTRSTGTQRVTISTDDIVQVSQSGTWNINSITTLPALPTGSNAIGKLVANSGIDIGDVTLNNALNSGTVDTNTIRVVDAGAANAAVTSVTAATAATALKAANTSRLGLTIFNNSASVLYVKLGTTASATDFSIKMAANSYYEVPFGYNGAVTGIWVAADGAALVTEIS
jgi:hypothetical protein